MKLVLVLLVGVFGVSASSRMHEDAGLGITELITKYGFQVQSHEIQTEDGYLITMHRIPEGRQNVSLHGVVLLMHGLTSSSADWVNSGEKSLGFLLADLGYDVWLGNSRGNRFGRKHISIDPDNDAAAFWTFSWDQIGRYDLPAMIDFVLKETGEHQLHYIGHSQGTTAFFVMTSERPEYNDKIRLMQAFAPVAFMNNLFNPIVQTLAQKEEEFENFFEQNEFYEVIAKDRSEECAVGGPKEEGCRSLLFLICGFDDPELDAEHVSVIMTNLPAGSGIKNFLHYGQLILSTEFRQWDYHSTETNIKHYGEATPPSYDVTKITAPVALHYGKNDWLASIVDVRRLRDLLPNVVDDHLIVYDKFNHADFLWAINVEEYLYNRVIELMWNF